MKTAEKKKVLVVANTDLGIGGIQSVIMSILRSLSDEFQFDIVVFDHTHTNYEEEVLRQGKIFTVQNRVTGDSFRKKIDYYIRFHRNYRELKNIIKENGPYVAIHCHNFYEAAIGLLVAKQERIPNRIVHSHSVLYVDKKKFIRRVYQAIYRRIMLRTATNFVACSQAAGEYLYGKKSDVQVVPNGIDVSKFSKLQSQCTNQWSFIQVGRWGPLKNQLFTIEVFAHIYRAHPEARLTFIGGGDKEYLCRIKEKSQDLNVEKAVVFLPENTDIPKEMAKNNALMFPSVFEGFGIVAIEAQAVGIKCFASTGVPREVNLGNVYFLNLLDGSERWANAISEKIEQTGTKRHYVNITSLSLIHI